MNEPSKPLQSNFIGTNNNYTACYSSNVQLLK